MHSESSPWLLSWNAGIVPTHPYILSEIFQMLSYGVCELWCQRILPLPWVNDWSRNNPVQLSHRWWNTHETKSQQLIWCHVRSNWSRCMHLSSTSNHPTTPNWASVPVYTWEHPQHARLASEDIWRLNLQHLPSSATTLHERTTSRHAPWTRCRTKSLSHTC